LCQISSSGLSITCDTECIVAIDGKIVGRLSAGQQSLFPVMAGKHLIAGANEKGAYWEKQTDLDGASILKISIPLLSAAVE